MLLLLIPQRDKSTSASFSRLLLWPKRVALVSIKDPSCDLREINLSVRQYSGFTGKGLGDQWRMERFHAENGDFSSTGAAHLSFKTLPQNRALALYHE